MRLASMLLTLFLIQPVTKAQEKDPLINTWLPINVTDYTGESDSWGRSIMFSIITFQANDTMALTYGGTDYKKKFFYRLHSDTLELKESEAESDYFKVLERSEDRLRIFFDSFNIVTYQPFEVGNISIDHTKLKKHLTSNIWTFKQVKSEYKQELLIDFRLGIQDSSLIQPKFIPHANDVYFKGSIYLNDDPYVWYISEFYNTLLLRIEGVGFSSFIGIPSLFFIESYNKKRLRAYCWMNGEKMFFVAKADKMKAAHKENLDLLFTSKWRFESDKFEKIKRRDTKGLMDLGMAEDNFYELTEPVYIHDSTFVISEDDLKQKRLVLEFEKNGAYRIYREARIIDSGKWKGYFNSTQLTIQSDKKYDSDGIIRGYIEILHLTKNKLVLRREFLTRLNGENEIVSSKIETYRPIR